jgi:hypothetical protein
MSRNNQTWVAMTVVLVNLACTTAQQSAPGATSTSPSPGVTSSTADAQTAAGVEPVAAAAADVRALDASGLVIGVTDVGSQTVGARVKVSGVFMGFSGACLTDAPSRSAWHLSASKEPKAPCIYVDGPFPAGLSPAVHGGSGVTITATVAQLGSTRYLVSTGE